MLVQLPCIALKLSCEYPDSSIAQEPASEDAGHCAFGCVDPKLQIRGQPAQLDHRPLASLLAGHIDVVVVGVAREAVAPRLQRLAHCDRLAAGLGPAGVRLYWAQKKKRPKHKTPDAFSPLST